MTEVQQRLFFALWPPAALQKPLADLARQAAREAGGKSTKAENLHLTLVFLGDCAPAQREQLLAGAGALRVPPFDLHFDHRGSWRHHGIVWLAPRTSPPALLVLVEALRKLAHQSGCAVERRPYAPHLTLARKAQSFIATQELEVLCWEARSFSLIESTSSSRGPAYRELACWPLSV